MKTSIKMYGKTEATILEMYVLTREHYLSEICKKTKLSRPSALRMLRKLEKLNILRSEKRANVKFYVLNKNKRSISLMSLVEYEKTENFLNNNPKIKTAVELIVEKTSPLITIIFGSYAKGYATKKSDLDILLVRDFEKNDLKLLEDLSSIVYGRTGINVSPIFITLEDLKKKNAFVNEVVKSHFIITGSELFYEAIL